MSLEINIEKTLGGFHLRSAFTLDSGVLGLLGASGSGKSMTLQCVAGIVKPDRGRIVLDGETLFDSSAGINLPPQRRRVGYLFQNYALYPHMSVKKNILCGLHDVKDRRERDARLNEALELFQLKEIANQKPGEISGGQAQRTALARILVNRPRLLMLDEPFSALDAHLRLQLQVELKKILSAYQGKVLMVTHSRDEAYHMCNSITVADRGVLGPVRGTKATFADPGSFAAARITGCKNIAKALRIGPHEVAVPEWNVRFTTAQEVREGLAGVAFRAHYLHPNAPVNRFPVTLADEMEEPFEWVCLFRYAGQDPNSSPVWWRLPKDKRPQSFPKELGIAPANILLLYDV